MRRGEMRRAAQRSVAAATTADAAGCAAGAFAALEHVIEVTRGDRIAIESHDGIGQMLALIGLHPGLHRASAQGCARKHGGECPKRRLSFPGCCHRTPPVVIKSPLAASAAASYSCVSDRIWSRYELSRSEERR